MKKNFIFCPNLKLWHLRAVREVLSTGICVWLCEAPSAAGLEEEQPTDLSAFGKPPLLSFPASPSICLNSFSRLEISPELGR